ncbi:MAG: universal stress protein [Gammaproteobacteria bacterium]|nr:MAG: universal stress protein [Gammaproteobacteria bacterium]
MEPYRLILLATDFSRESERIGQRAVDLARRFRAKIGIIHVVEHVPMDFPNDIVIPEQLDGVEFLVEHATEQLRRFAEQLGIPEAPQWVEVGSAKREIVRVAREQGADLIVLGSHGRHGLAALLGSTADGVMHNAPCDVLAVRIQA